jgi:hypothetical protein
MEGFPKTTAIASDRLFVDFFPGRGSGSCLYIIFQARCLESARLGDFWDIFFLFYTLLLALNYYRQIMGHFLAKNFSDYTDFFPQVCVSTISF